MTLPRLRCHQSAAGTRKHFLSLLFPVIRLQYCNFIASSKMRGCSSVRYLRKQSKTADTREYMMASSLSRHLKLCIHVLFCFFFVCLASRLNKMIPPIYTGEVDRGILTTATLYSDSRDSPLTEYTHQLQPIGCIC